MTTKRKFAIRCAWMLAALVCLATAHAGTAFVNSAGFSGEQGSNGWSYAVVHFSGAGSLHDNQVLLNYDSDNNWWTSAGVPGVSTTVRITTNQQSKAAGNAYFSLRYWTADKTYENVSVKSTWHPAADDSAAVTIVYYDASAGTESYPTSYEWSPAGGNPINVSAFLPRVDVGDRVYFIMRNSGQADDNYDRLHQWDQEIDVNAFNSGSGFTGAQGSNGWSYACVHFSGAGNLFGSGIDLAYTASQQSWGLYGVNITKTSQSKTEGNAYFSIRYWTAPADFENVSVQSTWYPATNDNAGVRVVFYKASSGTQSNLVDTLFRNAGDAPVALNAALPRVEAGDRVYFLMQNAGSPGSNSSVLHQWDQTIWATRFIPEGTVFSVR